MAEALGVACGVPGSACREAAYLNQEQSLTLSPAWVFFVADGETDDPPVYLFDDSNDRTYRQVARSLWEFVESLVIDYEIWSDSGLLRS